MSFERYAVARVSAPFTESLDSGVPAGMTLKGVSRPYLPRPYFTYCRHIRGLAATDIFRLMTPGKKLIEVALPLDAINTASASTGHEAGATLDWCRVRRLCEPEVRDAFR